MKIKISKNKEINEVIDPISIALGALITFILTRLFKGIEPIIKDAGTKIDNGIKEIDSAIQQLPEIPSNPKIVQPAASDNPENIVEKPATNKKEIFQKMEIAKQNLRKTCELLQKNIASLQQGKQVNIKGGRPTKAIALHIRQISSIIKEINNLYGQDIQTIKGLALKLKRGESVIQQSINKIKNLELVAALYNKQDPNGLYLKGLTQEVREKFKNKDLWLKFVEMLASSIDQKSADNFANMAAQKAQSRVN